MDVRTCFRCSVDITSQQSKIFCDKCNNEINSAPPSLPSSLLSTKSEERKCSSCPALIDPSLPSWHTSCRNCFIAKKRGGQEKKAHVCLDCSTPFEAGTPSWHKQCRNCWFESKKKEVAVARDCENCGVKMNAGEPKWKKVCLDCYKLQKQVSSTGIVPSPFQYTSVDPFFTDP